MALKNLEPTDKFFHKILHQGMQDETIQDVMLVEKKPAVNKGENYMSDLTRFTLKYTCNVPKGLDYERVHKVARLIMKEEPDASEQTLEFIRKMDIFNTERVMLEKVVPKIEELVKKRLGPKVYYSSIEPQMIIMEDLAAFGFKNTNRKLGLNLNQTLMILENLADFHAGSILLYEQNFEWLKYISNPPVHTNIPVTFYKMIGNTLSSVGKQIRGWPDDKFLPISEKLERISTEIAHRWEEIAKYDNDELCVLNHGDLWTNNIMFRNDDNGKLQELRLIDYQLCIWSSPALDLCHFLASGPELCLKGTNDEPFLDQYSTRLSNTMKQIGCTSKSPTVRQLKKSMHKRRMMSLVSGLVYFPKMVAEEAELENIEDILEKEKDDIDIMKNPMVKSTVKKMLAIWNERGYLD